MARQLLYQPFSPQVLAVAITPTPLSGLQLTQAYIDSLLITNFSTSANSVWIGDSNVAVGTGVEIPVGVTIQLSISNERPLYEVQNPLLEMDEKISCASVQPTEIPFIYWDLTQIFAIVAVAQNCVVTALKRPWV
jgi:hypothetical protein